MKTLTKTHIAKIRELNAQGMIQVLYLLQWQQQQYCDYLFEQYCRFIEEKYKAFPDLIVNKVLYSALFRGMFNNAAALRDEVEFIPFANDVIETIHFVNDQGQLEATYAVPLGGQYLIDEWKHIHSYKRLLLDDHFISQFNHILQIIKL